MINKEKIESIKANIIIKEINFPDIYNLNKLINFYNNCINILRELKYRDFSKTLKLLTFFSDILNDGG